MSAIASEFYILIITVTSFSKYVGWNIRQDTNTHRNGRKKTLENL